MPCPIGFRNAEETGYGRAKIRYTHEAHVVVHQAFSSSRIEITQSAATYFAYNLGIKLLIINSRSEINVARNSTHANLRLPVRSVKGCLLLVVAMKLA